jgi:hypothetical protein
VLPYFACIRTNGKKKERGFILAEREVDRVERSCFAWAGIASPAHGVSDRSPEFFEPGRISS